MVNIWATWCAPCIEEMPVLEQMSQEGEVGVVGIVIESREEEVRAAGAGNHHSNRSDFPHSSGHGGYGRGLFYPASARCPPHSLVDAEGNVVGGLFIGSRGELEWKDTIASVQEELNEGA